MLLLLIGTSHLVSQELNVNVNVTYPTLTKTDPLVLQNLEVAIKEFFNNTKWTDDNFEKEELINATIQLTIVEEIGINNFTADLIVQSNRPVYNASYNTPMLRLIDKGFSFQYNNRQPIEKSDNRYVDNLSSILTFYSYLIIAFDYESFSPTGGEPYFRLAQNTLTSVPSTVADGSIGWRNSNTKDRNRYWLIENIFNPRMRDFRSAFYDYHRSSMDNMYDDPDRSRAIMLATINTIRNVNRSYPNSYLLNLFVDTKREEIVEIFKAGDRGQKSQVYATLTSIDPSNASKYAVLK